MKTVQACSGIRAGVSALLLWLFTVATAEAQTPAWRGAWVADLDDVRHILYLVLQQDRLSGFYCADCSNPDNLAFIDDGVIGSDKLAFSLFRSEEDGTSLEVRAELQLLEGAVLLSLGQPAVLLSLRREPAPPPAAAPAPRAPAPPRVLPSEPELLSVDSVAGLWLAGSGPNKQYFIFKPHRGGLRGMVCGPCGSAQAFAPLENVRIDGSTLSFDIVHEDNGFGFAEHGPFRNLTKASIAMNEMQLSTVASYAPDAAPFEMTLLGPVRYRPPRRD